MKKISRTDQGFLEMVSELFFEKCNCKVCVLFRKQLLSEFNKDGTWKK